MACNFDEFGVCEMFHASTNDQVNRSLKRDGKWFRIYAPGVGCCNLCFSARGYFLNSRLQKGIKHLFLPIIGFWRPYGCSLKHEQKSDICQRFKCNPCSINDQKRGHYEIQGA